MLLPELHREIVGNQRAPAAVVEKDPPERGSDPQISEDLAAGYMHQPRYRAENAALRSLSAAGGAKEEKSFEFHNTLALTAIMAHGLARVNVKTSRHQRPCFASHLWALSL